MSQRIVVAADGHRYIISYSQTSDVLPVACAVARLAAPVVSFFNANASIADLGVHILTRPTLAADLLSVCKAFVGDTVVQSPSGQTLVLRDIFETHFGGRQHVLIEWMLAAIEHNCASFLAGLPVLLARL